jgi:hypothetical protein
MLATRAARRRKRVFVLVLTMLLVGFGSACGGSGPSTASPSRSPTTPAAPPSTPSTTPAPAPRPVPPVTARTAADDLAAFFAAARGDNTRIKAAARAINREIGHSTIQFSASTIEAVKASVPNRTARAIPAGMNKNLMRAALLVYSDLVARSAAFNYVPEFKYAPRAVTDPESVRLLQALAVGSAIARRYPADLAAARALAKASPPIVVAGADSRQAAELAVRVETIRLMNNCCGSAGGHVATELLPLTWTNTTSPHGPWTGTIGGIRFTATYTASDGWTVRLAAG